jgi:hypothetical protein
MCYLFGRARKELQRETKEEKGPRRTRDTPPFVHVEAPVTRPVPSCPHFLARPSGGHFRRRDPSFNDLPSRPLAARPRVPVFFLVAFLRPRRSSMVRTHPYYLPVCSPFILYALIYSTTLAHARF